MIIDGVRVVVPDRYESYNDVVKAAILRRVQWLHARCGPRLETVYVDRVMDQDTDRPRVHGGYCTR